MVLYSTGICWSFSSDHPALKSRWGGHLNLDGETLNLDGGTHPPYNLSTGYSLVLIPLLRTETTLKFISEHSSTFCNQISVVCAFTFNLFCPITLLFISFSNFAARYCYGFGRNFWLTKTAKEGNPQSRAVKARSDWMRHGLVHVGVVTFR